ncbi:pilus assembly protein CpaB [Elusimicrobium simillimum]|uniref:Flp pilus assembly protein CpaB n=1 Tax=Elusimicrobium simillimum TaxID=3143438 RepID=UPI003C703BCD
MFVQVPSKYIQKDAYLFTKDSDITKLENNLVTKIAIPTGNQVTKAALTSLSAEAGLSSRVPPLWRGFVLTDVPAAVANLIKPDDWVDILLTFEVNTKAGNRERITATILQRIKVLGVGSDLGQGMDAAQLRATRDSNSAASAFSDSSAISLALDPRDAQYLALAKSEGDITLVVRNATNTGIHSIPIASLTEMFK